MNQSVITFTSATARSSAITSPIEGMITYLEDNNSYQTFNGADWAGLTPLSPNSVINGAFDIWQRGSTFSNPASNSYTADRWMISYDGSGATRTLSRQSFTPGEINSINFADPRFYLRANTTVAPTGQAFYYIEQRIEDARTLANQVVTISFSMKAASAFTASAVMERNFGSGGSSPDFTSAGSFSVTSDWKRFSFTFTMPTVAGKTIGDNSYLRLRFNLPLNATSTVDIFGVQLEAGAARTPFRRNANSLQGELASCQRYYWRQPATSITTPYGFGTATSTTQNAILIRNPVTMRTSPASIEFLNLMLTDGATNLTPSSISLAEANPDVLQLNTAVTGATQYRPYWMRANATTNAFFAASAEL